MDGRGPALNVAKNTREPSLYSTEFRETMDSLLQSIDGASTQTSVEKPSKPFQQTIGVGRWGAGAQGPSASEKGSLSPESRRLIMESVEKALDVMGRTGREVFFEIVERRYGVTKNDIVESPGKLMSVLKIMFERTSRVFEVYALDEIRVKRGIEAGSLEEAVALLKVEDGKHRSKGPRAADEEQDGSRDEPKAVSICPKMETGDPILDFLNAKEHRPEPQEKYSFHWKSG